MDFRQLRTFSCVAELGSLSKASDTLRVAQPALSRQIKLLEHELRIELFTRNGFECVDRRTWSTSEGDERIFVFAQPAPSSDDAP